ncbi:hypothetical protein GPECTOR_1203g463 [Gonium pectorale]|uniref:Uncharacterized protein n=1 Tax=Gonium pectorale TaxID=33097 RepID=A0A150FV93_GONPE|nr:hypothetical protein GPECTOR_1203g463 [Gonium pectorale]|eukprot:KXZ40950.1 hypothetical protein GPECTOR_1203g463 [Gonium pectorale]
MTCGPRPLPDNDASKPDSISYPDGWLWMGILSVAASGPLLLLRFPAWGGMLARPPPHQRGSRGVGSEESYYLSEWTVEEQRAGLAWPAMVFARYARAERGGAAVGGRRGPTITTTTTATTTHGKAAAASGGASDGASRDGSSRHSRLARV